MAHRDERWALGNFAERYRSAVTGAAAELEQEVIGAVWGVNGYTTREQADTLGDLVEVGVGSRLLDLGSGRGWPGLYLAKRHGCDVVASDLPAEALGIALTTARDRGLGDRAAAVVASARDLPFTASSFDAVVHSDVLC